MADTTLNDGETSSQGQSESVFSLIHELHSTITKSIDTSLSWDQLNSPPVNYTVIRPIIERLNPAPKLGLTEKRGKVAGGGLLQVPKAQRSEEDGHRTKTKTNMEGDRSSEGDGKRLGLGTVLYALMANRIQFIGLADSDLSYAPLQTSRASFCELLAIKVLRHFPHPEEEAELVGQLVRGWCAFEGAPEEVWRSMGDDREGVEEMRGSALELAIVSNSKHFLSLPLIQHLVNQIYVGQLIYTPNSSRSLITDTYISHKTRLRRRPSHSSFTNATSNTNTNVTVTANANNNSSIPADPGIEGLPDTGNVQEEEGLAEVYTYNPYEASWLDHQRLRVPKWRKWLEFLSFGILLSLFIATLAVKELERVHPVEAIFVVVTFGFMLEEFAASKEHGWTVYSANAWNAFDLAYIFVFILYLVLRVFGLLSDSPKTSDLAFDILACAACILFPRLVFYLIKDNVVILALKGMIAKFVGFMGLTIVAFSGICFCLWTLGRGTWTVKQIVWLMLQIWFGSSYLGFSASESFHPIFGPIILIGYAALCNVLLITILISILSNEFADINANAQAEHLFQKVVKTVEGVKSDAIFSYLPPLNLLAFIFLGPLSYVVSPRTLHRINVFCIRLTSFPILIGISLYERWDFRSKRMIQLQPSGSMDRLVNPGLFDSFLGNGSEILISSVFEATPPLSRINQSNPPPKASSVTSGDHPSSDEDDLENENDNDNGNGYGNDNDRDMRYNRGSGLPGSPLAKVFGRRSTGFKPKSSQGKVPTSPVGSATKDEVNNLRAELTEVRASQLRMEEMLSKMLSGTGVDDK